MSEEISEAVIKKAELEEIAERRSRRCIVTSETTEDVTSIQQSLIGLSLSGGGIRSGAMCLGVLQALYQKKALPLIDYLSTVSGGSYAGAFLSSQALKQNGNSTEGNWALHSDPNGKQSNRMLKFIFSGEYIRRTWAFFNRHVIGLLLIWTVIFSGLISLAALIAYLFRCLDSPWVRYGLHPLGFKDDLTLAFFPSFVLLNLWGIAWIASYWKYGRRAAGKIAHFIFYALVITTVVAFAALLGTGDLSLKSFETWFGPDLMSRETTQNLGHYLLVAILSAIAAGLLPYLRPQELIRSGVAPKNTFEKYWFWAATRALLFGIPFAVVGFLAQENISLHNTTRNDKLQARSEIDQWKEAKVWAPFWIQVKAEYDENPSPLTLPGFKIWSVLSNETNYIQEEPNESSSSSGQTWTIGQAFLELEKESNAYHALNETLPLGFWWNVATISGEDSLGQSKHQSGTEHLDENEWWKHVKSRDKIEKIKDAIVERFAEKIQLDTTLYLLFEDLLPVEDPKLTIEMKSKLIPIIQEAKVLNKQIEAIATANNTTVKDAIKDSKDAIYRVNRNLLLAYYGDKIRPKSDVFSKIVLDEDQKTRWNLFLISLAIFVISCLLVDLNASSCHGFYSNVLANMWIEDAPGLKKNIPLAQLETAHHGYPYHLISGSLIFMGRWNRERGFWPKDNFLFSKLYCGSDRLNFCKTDEYMGGECTLEDATAISGAALSAPHTSNPLLVALLVLTNFRLGQWIPNPAHKRILPKFIEDLVTKLPVTPSRLLFNILQIADEQPFIYVADGGYFENLGIEPLLKRKCKLIIAIDAGDDQEYRFADLTQLIRWARMKHGIAIEPLNSHDSMPLHRLIPDSETRLSKEHCVLLRIKYSGDDAPQTGLLLYVKPTLTGDEAIDLLQYQKWNQDFPQDPSSDQIYEPRKFESYRQLGFHLGGSLCERLAPDGNIEKYLENGTHLLFETLEPVAQHEQSTVNSDSETSNVEEDEVAALIQKLLLSESEIDTILLPRFEEFGERVFECILLLIKAKNHPNQEIAEIINKKISEYPNEAFEALVKARKTPQAKDRILVMKELAELQEIEECERAKPILAALKDRSGAVKIRAIELLAERFFHLEGVPSALEKMQEDPNKKVQQAANKVKAKK